MKSTGLIVEYNPLHNGHLLHIREAKQQTCAEVCVAIMSGNYVQRGAPALLDKWTRTKMALQAGIDLVIELPFLFAVQNANPFADASIFLLKQLQADALVFGTEDGKLKTLEQAANCLLQLSDTAAPTKPNENYAQWMGRRLAAEGLTEQHRPNQILGIQYLRAITEQQAGIRPIAIRRSHADYHAEDFTHSQIASATAVRKALRENDLASVQNYVPPFVYRSLTEASFAHWDRLFPYLQMKVTVSSKEELRRCLLVDEGIEARIKKIIPYAQDFQDGIQQLKTKRYTRTRLMRTLLHIAANTSKAWTRFSCEQIPYIKVLGFNEKGRAFLHQRKKTCPLPIVHQPKNSTHPLMALEDQADRLYALLFPYEKRMQLMKRRLQGPVRI